MRSQPKTDHIEKQLTTLGFVQKEGDPTTLTMEHTATGFCRLKNRIKSRKNSDGNRKPYASDRSEFIISKYNTQKSE